VQWHVAQGAPCMLLEVLLLLRHGAGCMSTTHGSSLVTAAGAGSMLGAELHAMLLSTHAAHSILESLRHGLSTAHQSMPDRLCTFLTLYSAIICGILASFSSISFCLWVYNRTMNLSAAFSDQQLHV
jgi:hypothetical protein